MDYQGFMNLHDLLKDRKREYIRNNNNRADQSTPSNNNDEWTSFHIPNGAISTQICLAAALRFFAGGSYFDIAISRGIGQTDVYRSVWLVVHATNISTASQF